MQAKVFYFSATGNSFAIARDIANQIDAQAELISIATMDNNDWNFDGDVLGIIFPIHFLNIPKVVVEFIRKLKVKPSCYVFCACTYGALYGDVLYKVEALLKESGIKLAASFPVNMPGNNIILYRAFPVSIQKYLFKNAKKKVIQIADYVKNFRKNVPTKSAIHIYVAIGFLFLFMAPGVSRKGFYVSEKCNGCGLCQRACHCKNITLIDNKPQWSSNCEGCLACIQWCPTEAIYAQKTLNRKHYHHPKVSYSDLF
jgi:ferredoxin